jgi:hypothetical protein
MAALELCNMCHYGDLTLEEEIGNWHFPKKKKLQGKRLSVSERIL